MLAGGDRDRIALERTLQWGKLPGLLTAWRETESNVQEGLSSSASVIHHQLPAVTDPSYRPRHLAWQDTGQEVPGSTFRASGARPKESAWEQPGKDTFSTH